jgi:hypothetical protein
MALKYRVFYVTHAVRILNSVHQPTNAFKNIQQNTYHTVQCMVPGVETCRSLILIMNCILWFVFYFNLLSALLVDILKIGCSFFYLMDNARPAGNIVRFITVRPFGCLLPVIEWYHPTRDVGRNAVTVFAGHLSESRREYLYARAHTHTFEKCAVVVRFKPAITLQPLPKFCNYFHNPKTR